MDQDPKEQLRDLLGDAASAIDAAVSSQVNFDTMTAEQLTEAARKFAHGSTEDEQVEWGINGKTIQWEMSDADDRAALAPDLAEVDVLKARLSLLEDKLAIVFDIMKMDKEEN